MVAVVVVDTEAVVVVAAVVPRFDRIRVEVVVLPIVFRSASVSVLASPASAAPSAVEKHNNKTINVTAMAIVIVNPERRRDFDDDRGRRFLRYT